LPNEASKDAGQPPQAKKKTKVNSRDKLGSQVTDNVTEGIPQVQRLQLKEDLAQEFETIARTFSDRLDRVIVKPYVPGYKPDSPKILYASLESATQLAEVVGAFSNFDSLAMFAEDDAIIRHLKFYGIAVESGKHRAVFFRHYSPMRELGRSKRLAVMFSKGAYDKIHEKIFLFDREIDCVAWNGYMFIANVHQYHLMFQYFRELLEKSKNTLDAFLTRVPVHNETEFREACTTFPMMAKLASIAANPNLNKITMDGIRERIKTNNLPVKIATQDGREGLFFETALDKRWIILKLFDDDYVRSPMTGAEYDANSKIPIR
jgi:hypothetical protein